MIPATFLGVMAGSLMEVGVHRGKSGGERPLSSKVELAVNCWANTSALSFGDDTTI